MLLWVILALVVALAAALWFLPVQLRAQLRQESWEAILSVELKAPLLTLHGEVNISDKVRMVFDHILKRWLAKGEPVSIPVQKTIRRFPRRQLVRVLRLPLRYLGRHVRCRRLEVRAEVGGADAMESALLAGASWAVLGYGIGLLSRKVRIPPGIPDLRILPNFGAQVWRIRADCILNMQLGHAIVTGVWLLREILRKKEIVAWARDSLRRKGVNGGGRTSDSGTDEDRYGVH